MKQVFMLLALVMLAGCAAPQPGKSSAETPAPSLGPDQYDPNAEYATAEEREAWFEEQTALAEEFLEEHQELLNEISAAILETEVAEQYLYFIICPGYCDGDTPHLESFWRACDEYRYEQGCHPIDPELTLAGLSEELDLLANELCALHPMGITYKNGEYSHSLEIGFASSSFPGAFFCDVFLRCDIDQKETGGYTWEVTQHEFCMDGL